jgi:YebC/PmpR family DNA-binding regulatory protein
MARHSKWHKIRNFKGAADARRGAVFTQLARAIAVAAREKGGDPNMNYQLKTAIEKAKAANMPKDNIERAVKRGTGELGSEALETLLYEGYGPGGAAVLVESLTDNRSRTAPNMKRLFSKHGGNLGGSGSVAWMFERKGVIRVRGKADELALIDAGADDVKKTEDGFEVTVPFEELQAAKERIEKAGFEAGGDAVEYLAKETVPFDAEKHSGLETLLESLEDDEDVQATYTNVEL